MPPKDAVTCFNLRELKRNINLVGSKFSFQPRDIIDKRTIYLMYRYNAV
jgi:hypothetical protein